MKMNTKTATKMLRKVTYEVQKRGPKLKLMFGIAGVCASTYFFCKGAVKAEDVKKNFKEKHEAINNKYGPLPKKATTEEEKQLKHEYHGEMSLLYREATLGFLKCYGLPAMLEAASIVLIGSSHHDMSKRNAALAAAFSTSESAYQKLRESIREKYGVDAEQELVNGVTQKEITTETVDEKGKKKKVKEKVSEITGKPGSYNILIEKYPDSDEWDTNPWDPSQTCSYLAYSGWMVGIALRYQNGEMISLNEIYRIFGHKKVEDGYMVGFNPYKDGAPLTLEDGIHYAIHELDKVYTDEQGNQERTKAYLIELNVDPEAFYYGDK